jgi:PBP1b-binding outer membrane lipoprotein LpoB
MKFKKSIILLSGLFIILNSCSSLKEAGSVLRNEKTKTNDEFLIQKKEPLTQPPDFNKIPEPGSIEENVSSEQNSIEKILKTRESKSISKQSKSSSTEESILRQIKR